MSDPISLTPFPLKVSSFTERFAGAGGKACSTYNAGTDGGYTGTGRAENALQTRLLVDFLPETWGIEPFSLNIQIQDGEPIPRLDGHRYGHAIGLSALLATRDNFSFGIAYHHARIGDSDHPEIRAQGIDGDATAAVAGVRWFDNDWYLATVAARLENHETTDAGNYFDGWGWEVYGQYRLKGPWWMTGGWNWLEPDSGQPQAGDYRIKYGILGVRYSMKDFDQYLYLNLRGERSLNQDGSGVADILTAGIRWAF